MKSKAQKQEELKKAKELLGKSKTILFAEITKVPAEDLRRMRRELSSAGAKTLVMKKRLLNVLFKEQNIGIDARQFDSSISAIFAEGALDAICGPLFKFFSSLGVNKETKEAAIKKILGAYDLETNALVDATTVRMIGQLPPREVLLAQLFGMLAAPIRSILYILKEKSARSG